MMTKLESCLIMVRSFYAKHSDTYESYIKNHPSTQPNEDAGNANLVKSNTNILLSKMQANMIMQCDAAITEEQIQELAKFKQKPEKFDSTKKGYADLVDIDLRQFDLAGMEAMTGQVA